MSFSFQNITPGIQSRYDRSELKQRLSKIDIVAVDIDECIFPGFSQTALGHSIFLNISLSPHSLSDLCLLPQLIRGGAYIRKVELLQKLGTQTTNLELMLRYEQTMMNIPQEYFIEAVCNIPDKSFEGVKRALFLLSTQAKVGLISFGIDLIAQEYMKQFTYNGKSCLSFAESNHIYFKTDKKGRPVFAGYHRPLKAKPEDKRQILKDIMAKYRASCPMIIGNSLDDEPMAALAREKKGLAIGFHPPINIAQSFDVVVMAPNWNPLALLIEQILA